MRNRRRSILALLYLCLLLRPTPARAQTIEMAGSRATGMGGAFVAVANDSSATWWNPAGLADGPFVDLALVRNSVQAGTEQPPAWRGQLSSLTLATPPAGVSYYRFRLTDIGPPASTASDGGDRQTIGTGVVVRSIPASQLGVTLVRTLISGLHIGTTLKYVRGEVLAAAGEGSVDSLLDAGDGLEGDDSDSTFDLDVGVLGILGPFRAGGVVRNVLAAELGEPLGVALPRQIRVGLAFDGDAARLLPLTVAVDADITPYDGPGGERRVIAVGAEQWFVQRRLGVRAGARFNTVGAEESSVSVGVSVAIRSGLYLDGHVVSGGSADERGWGAAARVSF
jgi:hypothetical protein